MVISKYTKFPDKKRTTTSMWFSFFFGWNSFQSHIVRLRNKKARIRLRAFLFLNNPETFGCVVKAWMVQMAVRGGYRQVPYYILYMKIYRNTRKKMQKNTRKK